jgi:hypothetical protein
MNTKDYIYKGYRIYKPTFIDYQGIKYWAYRSPIQSSVQGLIM